MSIHIRSAQPADINGITDIYNEAILSTDATFDTEPKSIAEQKQWYNAHGPRNPIMVAEENNHIIGWASLSEWSTRCAYSDTAEISLYIKSEYRNHGTGTLLMKAILEAGKKVGLHTVLSRITNGNSTSIHLHEKFGFKHIGTMKEVGIKQGKLLDVDIMQLIYPPKQ